MAVGRNGRRTVRLPRTLGALMALALAGMSGVAAQVANTPQAKLPHSAIPGLARPAGLWDKPNEACMRKCRSHVKKDCFTRLAEKSPGADPAAIHEKCEDTFSLCLYDCMCDTCDKNQIVIKKKKQ